MSEYRVDDVKGVFTNGDPEQLGTSWVKEFINFKSKNGKIVKTFGASDLGIFKNIPTYSADYEVESLVVYPNENFSGNKYRYVAILKNSKSGRLITLFDRSI